MNNSPLWPAGLPIQICPAAITLAHEQRRGRLASAKINLVPEADKSFHLVYDRLEDPVRLLLHSAALFNQRILRDELSTQLQTVSRLECDRF